jgi:DNA-binding NtrC family response regulator
MPSLRERPEDLPAIVDQLLAEHGSTNVSLTPEAWSRMRSYSWPGNIRELKNVLYRALLLRRGNLVAETDIRFDSDARMSSGTFRAAAPIEPPPESKTLEDVEREHITRALTAEHGRVKDAARRLGIPRSTLYQKLKNYGISLPPRARGSDPPT